MDLSKLLKYKLNIQANLKETLSDEDYKYDIELWLYGDIDKLV